MDCPITARRCTLRAARAATTTAPRLPTTSPAAAMQRAAQTVPHKTQAVARTAAAALRSMTIMRTARLRPETIVRTAVSRPQTAARSLLHTVPQHRLPFSEASAASEGLPGLFSAKGVQTGWFRHQRHLLDALNERTQGTDLERNDLHTVVLRTTRHPEHAAVFNYASQAWNNHFFYTTLKSASSGNAALADMPLEAQITTSFGEVALLKEQLLTTALSVFGSGWVWLVRTYTDDLRVLATYNAGAPFDLLFNMQADPNTGYSFSTVPAGAQKLSIQPLLGVSCWEHTYLHDYGVDGRSKYLEAWWNTINWDEVNAYFVRAKNIEKGEKAKLLY